MLLSLPSGHFHRGFVIKILYAFSVSPILASYQTHPWLHYHGSTWWPACVVMFLWLSTQHHVPEEWNSQLHCCITSKLVNTGQFDIFFIVLNEMLDSNACQQQIAGYCDHLWYACFISVGSSAWTETNFDFICFLFYVTFLSSTHAIWHCTFNNFFMSF